MTPRVLERLAAAAREAAERTQRLTLVGVHASPGLAIGSRVVVAPRPGGVGSVLGSLAIVDETGVEQVVYSVMLDGQRTSRVYGSGVSALEVPKAKPLPPPPAPPISMDSIAREQPRETAPSKRAERQRRISELQDQRDKRRGSR